MIDPIPSKRPHGPLDLDHQTAQRAMKTTFQSRTVLSALAALLLAVWQPLVLGVGGLLVSLGLDVDPTAWVALADDGELTRGDFFIIVRDLVIATLMLLVIHFRRITTELISGWFGLRKRNTTSKNQASKS